MSFVASNRQRLAEPERRRTIRMIRPGVQLKLAVYLLVVSFGFGLYVANFGSYNATYGTLGGVVVLLIWFYLTAFLLLVGAEINAVIAEKETGTEAPVGGRQAVGARTWVRDNRRSCHRSSIRGARPRCACLCRRPCTCRRW